MNKTTTLILTLTASIFMSCHRENKAGSIGEDNPLLATWDTPYGAPPFNEIKTEHYKPALQEAMRIQQGEIDAIANSHEQPNFKNTIVALENTGTLLTRIVMVFENLTSANTNPEMQALAQEMAPALSKHYDDIYLNQKLFTRVKSVWDNQIGFKLNREEAKLLEKKYKAFVRSGANLNDDQKDRLRKINEELAVIALKFGDNVLAETNSFELVVSDKKDLAGLPQEAIAAAADDAKAKGKDGKWLFTLQNASVMPFLQYADNRELRKKIWTAYQNRGNNGNATDNRINVIQLTNLRAEKAHLLGYKSHAHFVLEERMAKTPERVYELLDQLWKPALEKAKAEEADIKKLMVADGINDAVQPYDWRYYTEKIRKQRYNLDEQEIKPYFSLDNVREGIFTVAGNLYGLKFKQLKDVPVYQKDVTAWEVTEADGKLVGILYMDFYPRASKSGGAWMTSYRDQKMQDGKRIAPIISIVCNFTKPTGNTPALLTFDETTTFFHEFGHALHGLLSNVNYVSLAGTNVPTDFVELPSQVMENWAAEPEVLKLYAKHYKTGAVIPDELITKLQESATFDQGFATVEYLAASYLDLDYHSRTEDLTQNVAPFEEEAMKKLGLIPSIIPRYRSTYYNHIFSGGYSAGYYSYIWSGVLDTDAFEAFRSTSLFDKNTAKAFRTNILERGGTGDPQLMYEAFRGAKPSIEPLLRKRGLEKKTPQLQNTKMLD
ncbi:M3 family metallopeptidase [Flavobacterium subsaxonicum]|uniref:Peptidase M3 n=1 Tax=Flavobacterium subsaxonicum WB 4.1-42 = DSM 21790 TaxID=1121898 RepID=A0A0A2MIQ2_9FLAO|nr:M3 family metallopeptidase [Flavobacterium subsaxonicum]KGO91486.1 peptidase M3 [Flavobacterium subsaxonicum WB 4.1-42 = DSM 21790]